MTVLLDKFAQTCRSKKKLTITKQDSNKPDSKKSKVLADLASIKEKKTPSQKEESE